MGMMERGGGLVSMKAVFADIACIPRVGRGANIAGRLNKKRKLSMKESFLS